MLLGGEAGQLNPKQKKYLENRLKMLLKNKRLLFKKKSMRLLLRYRRTALKTQESEFPKNNKTKFSKNYSEEIMRSGNIREEPVWNFTSPGI